MTTIRVENQDRKTLKTVVKTIKTQLSSSDIKLEFHTSITPETFKFIVHKAKLKYHHFKERVKISGINKIQLYDYIWDATHAFRFSKWLVSIPLVLVLSIVGLIVYKNNIKNFTAVLKITEKIDHLASGHLKDLEKYYSKLGTSWYATKFKIAGEVNRNCTKLNLNPNLVIAIIRHESEFRKYAISSVGAVGFMQVYLRYWSHLITNTNVDSAFREDCNIETGCYILSTYLEKNKNDIYKAMINYNGGDIYNTDSKTVINSVTFNYIKDIVNSMNELGLELYKQKGE